VTRAQALERLRARLRAAGVHPAGQEAEWLLAHALKTSPSSVWRDRDRDLDPEQEAFLEDVTRRRERREPLQLILGSAPFHHVTLQVEPGVFIPRPETEELVEAVLAALTQEAGAGARGARGGPREFRSERTPPATAMPSNERGLSEARPPRRASARPHGTRSVEAPVRYCFAASLSRAAAASGLFGYRCTSAR
jgi:hypothetical protein